MAELPEGTVFAGHRIEAVAGRGGMGVVYRATHIALDHTVALKVIAPQLADDARFRERFVRESRTAVAIRHPNVVQVRHAGEEDGVLFVTMDFIDGYDLRGLINAERRVEPERVARIVAQIASALDEAHQRGLVHRDVKPGNVLLEQRGGEEHAYLTDFGLTKRMTGATELTASGAFIGTVEYMAPEQIRGEELDARTDVYALAGVAFAALTGEPPFGRVEGDVAKLYAQLNDPPPRATDRVPELPPALDAVLRKGMAKKREDRYASAGEFAAALTGAVRGEVGAPAVVPVEPTAEAAAREPKPAITETLAEPPTAATRVGAESRRGRRALVVIAGVAIIAAAAGIVALAGGGDGDGGGGGSDPTGPATVEELPAGDWPVGVEADGDLLLVASRDDGRLSTWEAENGTPVASHEIDGAETDFLVAGPRGYWTADGDDNVLYRIDPETLEPVDDFPTGAAPRDIAVTDEGIVWVANRDGNSLTRVDSESGEAEDVRVDGTFPRRLALDGELIWVAMAESGSVQALDSSTGEPAVGPVDVEGEPHGIQAADGFLWVANTGANSVQKLDLDDPTGRIRAFEDVCDEPRDVELAFGSLWVSCGNEHVVLQLDPSTGELLGEIESEFAFEALTSTIHPDRVWAANGGGAEVIGIDPGT